MKNTFKLWRFLMMCLLLGNQSLFALEVGPAGYTYCASEGQSFTLPGLSSVAYGGNGLFVYRHQQLGTILFSNNTFGDPAPGAAKAGYYKAVTEAELSAMEANLAAAIQALMAHQTGATPLSPAQLNEQAAIIASNRYAMGNSATIITAAFALAEYFEAHTGPLFMTPATQNGFINTPGALDGFELARAMLNVQQAIHDFAFTAANIAAHQALLEGRTFLTATYFPGAVAAPANPATIYTAPIKASMPAFWGRRTAWSATPATRPTGYYLAPGSIGTVTVPAALVNKGFVVRVGAHTRDRSVNGPIRRLFRVSKDYPITSLTTKVANPLGGGIYIVTPYLADQGLVDVQIANVVPAPFFSATSFHQTSLQEWLNTQRSNPGPWADFESDKFMMQVPRSWIYNFSNPVNLMQEWDKQMDGVSELLGYPLVRNNTILYNQVDTDIMSSGFGVGYPQINHAYDPKQVENGNKNHWLLTNGSNLWPTEYHELGHAQLFSDFQGEREAAINMVAAYLWNRKYGVDLDLAFGKSFGEWAAMSRDQAAMTWMVTANFRAGNPMDISNTTKDEVKYQHRGHAKYIEIAGLFGWDVLNNFYFQENLDYMAQTPSDGLAGTDSRLLRMSKAAGVDLRPLIHFWGVQPVDANNLKSLFAAAGLAPSRKIYDRLVHYKTSIPMDNAAFRAHAHILYPNGPRANLNPDFGEGWYYVWLPQYNETHGADAQTAMQSIIDLYFPAGRPDPDSQPLIVTQPRSLSVTEGQTATFTVTATSAVACSYQWRNNNVAISGATTASYTTPVTLLADSGTSFTVVVTAMGTVVSSSAILTVVAFSTPPVITRQPQDLTIPADQTASLTVSATGGNLNYQWYQGLSGDLSLPLAGATSDTFTTPALSLAATYWVRLSNAYGVMDSLAATVRIAVPAAAPEEEDSDKKCGLGSILGFMAAITLLLRQRLRT